MASTSLRRVSTGNARSQVVYMVRTRDSVQGVVRPAASVAAFAFTNYTLYLRHAFCRTTSNSTPSEIP